MIGLNADFANASGEKPGFAYVAAGYFDAITSAGGIPIILPPINDDDDLKVLVKQVDGLVFVGGADLDPRRDGWMLHTTTRPLASRRELFDRRLARIAADYRIPVLGIGAGMQLLNVSLGGNLLLHIPEDRPNALPHHDPSNPAHRHALEVAPGSIIEQAFGNRLVRVNSMHHMAVDEVAPGFEVTGWSPDGIVEVIESRISDWFAIGTQFHPEADTASALDLTIFEVLVERALGESRLAATSLVG